MHKYNVIFEVFNDDGTKKYETVSVEAGNKKIAALRGMKTINKIAELSDKFKNVARVEEVL